MPPHADYGIPHAVRDRDIPRSGEGADIESETEIQLEIEIAPTADEGQRALLAVTEIVPSEQVEHPDPLSSHPH